MTDDAVGAKLSVAVDECVAVPVMDELCDRCELDDSATVCEIVCNDDKVAVCLPEPEAVAVTVVEKLVSAEGVTLALPDCENDAADDLVPEEVTLLDGVTVMHACTVSLNSAVSVFNGVTVALRVTITLSLVLIETLDDPVEHADDTTDSVALDEGDETDVTVGLRDDPEVAETLE